MVEIVARFEISYSRCLDPAGKLVAPLPPTACDSDQLIALYRAMVRTRSFDAKAVALQRTGRLGTFASSLGQEAVSVGAASAMREEDVLLPSFREQGAQLWRGVTPLELFLYWGGDERGSNFARAREDFPVCVPVSFSWSAITDGRYRCLGIGRAPLRRWLRRRLRQALTASRSTATMSSRFTGSLQRHWSEPAAAVALIL